MPSQPASSPRPAVVAVAVVAVVLVLLGQLTDPGAPMGDLIGFSAGIGVSFTVMGALVLRGVPGHPVGWLMTAAGLLAAVNLVALSWSGVAPVAWLAQWTWLPALSLVFLALLVFPDGRLPSRRWRPAAALLVTATAVATVALAVAALSRPRTLLTSTEPPLAPWAERLVVLAGVAALLAVVGYAGALVSLGARWRRADADTRRQLACMIPAGVVLLAGLVLYTLGLPAAWAVMSVAVPLGMTIAILRYHLYDLDVVVNRTLVWFIMTVLVVVGFVAIVRLLSAAVQGVGDENASLVATGIIAVSFQPLHRRVQRSVDHLLYGDRDDPYAVIARLGDVLGRTVEPTAVLPLLTGTIAVSLQVPYVAVELEEDDGPRLAAEHGRLVTATEAFDMVAHGQRVGRLLVAERSPTSRFSRHECCLLRDVAVQAAVAVDATRLTRDLQTSRERLVMAREEERRRLRRDLHDGLGPSLAGMSMQLRAARRILDDGTRPAAILDALAADLKSCTAEVRLLVDELRPPVLDRGLEDALRAECSRFGSGGLVVRCDVDGPLDQLPAAVEVAVYRMVAEALTNVARHSRADRCQVTVSRDAALTVDIVDDGVGFSAPLHAGVGLRSMAERAAELGGTCNVTPAPGGGTAVRIELPLEPSAPRVATP